jgi:hypothetical protein
MEIHAKNGLEQPPKFESFTTAAMKVLLRYIHSSIKAIVDDDVAEEKALEEAIGAAGSLDQTWTRFAHAPDLDSARKCMTEITTRMEELPQKKTASGGNRGGGDENGWRQRDGGRQWDDLW